MSEPTKSVVDPDVEELEALGRVANAFQQYYADAKLEIERWEWNYSMYVKQVHSFFWARPFFTRPSISFSVGSTSAISSGC